ncbi:hypothetical protein [Streptomyces zingiberis]|uniref:Secreted protein n=1 Tax=Streptomyces zingiberis TaxID=2053010 RepID=A0ABX1C133_9ACTN|nr:hypothetical protein [Streptomyces zingiberis]NJQ03629.1 hypothetical protein [Streptomyces zingiberis]
MRLSSRTIGLLSATVLAAGGLTAATAPTAHAGPSKALACYDTAKSFSTTLVGSYHRWPASGSATTTANCNDINVKPAVGDDVRTCFLPSGGGTSCNGWRRINGGSWGLAATDVRTGTKFYLQFRYGYESGSVAY